MYIIQFLDNGEVYGKTSLIKAEVVSEFCIEYGDIYYSDDEYIYQKRDPFKTPIAKIIKLAILKI